MKSTVPAVLGIRRTDVWPLFLSSGAVAAAATLEWIGSDAYAVVLGVERPVVATVGACLLGLVGLRVVEGRGWCGAPFTARSAYLVAVLCGAALPMPMLMVDVFGGFPRVLNASAPASFLFYPAIAVVAEFMFHVIPLASVAAVTSVMWHSDERARQMGLALAALAEPVFQVAWGTAQVPAWVSTSVGVQVLIFNIIGVGLFRRHGFLVVYLYRLTYYAVWHILWGYLRLGILFGN